MWRRRVVQNSNLLFLLLFRHIRFIFLPRRFLCGSTEMGAKSNVAKSQVKIGQRKLVLMNGDGFPKKIWITVFFLTHITRQPNISASKTVSKCHSFRPHYHLDWIFSECPKQESEKKMGDGSGRFSWHSHGIFWEARWKRIFLVGLKNRIGNNREIADKNIQLMP